ncbi:hypothetical protein E4U57_001896 [Claviceps arundinis]|uniref:Suppressor of anucleate metulae protein B n=1 Tax=Claviceps arundinis TaxID=1623583 RepID=A0ABQ7PBM2_9HYPO|nr:hypothetical protein E4U57_001896 [Claviceps arundinis]
MIPNPSALSSSSSSSIQVRAHPSKHRALHATRALPAGHTIHIFTSPLLLLPTLAHLSSVCAHCLRPGTPRACSRCHAAYYCDATCQRAGWAAVHSRECKALRARRGRSGAELPTPVRALLQVLLLGGEVEKGLAMLDGHEGVRRGRGGRAWGDLEMMAAAACAFAGKEGDERRAVGLLCKIQTNAFLRFDAHLADQVGIFLDPTLAMANHSCVPNATVLFIGRTAVLRAERDIREGDEIEVCYTDYTNPISQRKSALQEYCFTCQCPRCANNLNVYQLCAQLPTGNGDMSCSVLGSNTSSLQNHLGASDPQKIRVAAQFCTEPDPELTGSSPEAKRMLKIHLTGYKPLIENDLWAVSPLPQILTEVSLYYTHEQKFAYAVAVAAMVAVECDPYRYAAPFHAIRLKNLLMVIKLLVLTAEVSAALRQVPRAVAARGLEGEVLEMLAEMDQVSLSQMLLLMVMKSASPPGGGLEQWSLEVQAKELYEDIAGLEGREQELSLIHAWRDDPESESSQRFFEYAVVKQMAALADLGKRVVRTEWQV